MEYRPLDTERDEIRLLSFVPPWSAAHAAHALRSGPDIIQCTLHHFSLSNMSSDYREYLGYLSLEKSRSGIREEDLPRWSFYRERKNGGRTHQDGDFNNTANTGDSTSPSIQNSYRFAWGDYVALSYVWGDTAMCSKIAVNGHIVEVTENLECALRKLACKYTEGTLLWVDVLCINQRDIAERNAQVKRMTHIYSQACTTIAWLGDEIDDSDMAIKLILDLASLSTLIERGILPRSETNYEAINSITWVALYHWLDRAYWKRLWVIQEIVMSQDELRFFCGDNWLGITALTQGWLMLMQDWSALTVVVQNACREAGLEALEYARIGVLINRMNEILSSFQHRRRGDVSLSILVSLARSSDQTDIRDKTYGIMGLLHPLVSDHIEPDYRLSVKGNFTAFTKAIYLGTRDLSSLIDMKVTSPNRHDVPSWALDLNTPAGSHLPLSKEMIAYCTSGASLPAVGFAENNQ
jgi:hypothetical protein